MNHEFDFIIMILSMFLDFRKRNAPLLKQKPQMLNSTSCVYAHKYINEYIFLSEWVSEFCLIFQLYHSENKLIFKEMMMGSALY